MWSSLIDFVSSPSRTRASYVTTVVESLRHTIDDRDHDGCTALFLAVKCRDYALVRILTVAGADPNIADNAGTLPIYMTVTDNDILMCKLLLDSSLGTIVDAIQPDGQIPIHAAVHIEEDNRSSTRLSPDKHAENSIIDMMLERGVFNYATAEPKNDNTVLHLAIYKSRAYRYDLVTKAVGALNVRNCIGDTPLHIASRMHDWDMVKLLLSYDETDVNIRDDKGRLALSYALLHDDCMTYEILGAFLAKSSPDRETGPCELPRGPLHRTRYKIHSNLYVALFPIGTKSTLWKKFPLNSGNPLIAWARMYASSYDDVEIRRFVQMLHYRCAHLYDTETIERVQLERVNGARIHPHNIYNTIIATDRVLVLDNARQLVRVVLAMIRKRWNAKTLQLRCKSTGGIINAGPSWAVFQIPELVEMIVMRVYTDSDAIPLVIGSKCCTPE